MGSHFNFGLQRIINKSILDKRRKFAFPSLSSLKQFTIEYSGGYYFDGSDWNVSPGDEIVEFDPLTGQWNLVDRMMDLQRWHAVSVIHFESRLCV